MSLAPMQCLGEADGKPCDDSNACTQTDTCQNDACVGSNPVVCTAQDQCHTAGTCNTSTGVCSNPPKADGTACSDGNACTQTDTCQAGTCTGSNPVVCTAQDQCHTAGTCNTSTGVCSNPTKADGTACSDGNACTQGEQCQSGSCTGSAAITCDDADPCTTNSCNPGSGCTYPSNGLCECDDSGVSVAGSFPGATAPGTVQVAIHPADPNRLYLTSPSGMIYRSDDAGTSWVAQCYGNGIDRNYGKLTISNAADGTVYATAHTQLYRVEALGGANCPYLGSVWASYFDADGIAIGPEGRLWRWAIDGLFYSDNQGTTWTQQAGYAVSLFKSLAVDPFDATAIVSVHQQWSSSPASGIHVGTTLVDSTYSSYSNGVMFHPVSSGWIYLGKGGRYSSNGGLTWTSSANHAVWALNGTTGSGYRLTQAGSDVQLQQSTNLTSASPTWSVVYTFPGATLGNYPQVAARGATIGVVMQARLYVSTNGGSTFAEAAWLPASTSSSIVATLSGLYAVTGSSIFRSINGGSTWQNIASLADGVAAQGKGFMEFSPASPNQFYIRNEDYNSTYAAGFAATSNAFTSFTANTTSSPFNSWAAASATSAVNPQLYYWLGWDKAVRSTDGGATTTSQSSPGQPSNWFVWYPWHRNYVSPWNSSLVWYGASNKLYEYNWSTNAVSTDITSRLPFTDPAGMEVLQDGAGGYIVRVISQTGKLAISTDGTNYTAVNPTGGLSSQTARILASLPTDSDVVATSGLLGSNAAISVNGGASWTPLTVTCSVRDIALTSTRAYFACASNARIQVVDIEWLTGCTPKTVPGAPTNVIAVPGDGEAAVGFSAPADTGGLPLSGYEVEVTPGGAIVSGAASPVTITGLANGQSYTFRVRALNTLGAGAWSASSAAVVPSGPPLYSFDAQTFTSCGQTGPTGPSLAQCLSSYVDPEDDEWKLDSGLYDVVSGIQEWTAPATGTYRITAAGARGGDQTSQGRSGGSGTIVRGDFDLIAGETIRILVGHVGKDQGGDTGGGGGSFVALDDDTPLIVAGGGGGAAWGFDGVHATFSDPSAAGYPNGPAGSSGGAGGAGNSYGGAGGGGYSTGDGNGAQGGGPIHGGASFLAGGGGGRNDNPCGGHPESWGGFGGGGAGPHCTNSGSGGGGGYSGGAGGAGFDAGGGWTSGAGGGGSSYNDGSNPSNVGLNDGAGYVSVELL